MSTWYRAPEIRFLQDQGRLNGTLDPWSDSESDDGSFTKVTGTKEEKKERKMNERPQKMWIRPYEEKDREAVAEVVRPPVLTQVQKGSRISKLIDYYSVSSRLVNTSAISAAQSQPKPAK